MAQPDIMTGVDSTQVPLMDWHTNDTHTTPELAAIEDMKDIIHQVVTPEERADSWYHKAITAVGSSLRSVSQRTRAISADEYLNKPLPIEEYLNKPLPPLPQQPYFEYMFADAGLEAKGSHQPSRMLFKAGQDQGEN